ncbi:MAG: tyrosine-type recombinase/integrase [Eubacteriales bacterium]|nr:tyrosine-type recombinase/integrase [Eubacteriales bacterium]
MPRRGENIHKRKDNRWEGRFIRGYDSLGKAKYGSVYGKTYFEVKKKLNEVSEQLSKNALPQGDHEISFREVLFLWLQSNRIKLKDQTYAKYQFLADTHLIPTIGSTKIRKVDSCIINRFLEQKSKNGRIDGKGGLSSSYIQTLSFIIQSVIEYAVAEGYRPPLSGSITKPAKKRKSFDVLSITEQEKLLHYVSIGELNDKKLGILLSLYTGMRIGEVCGLMWSDIDFTSNVIHICHTVERIKNLDAGPDDNKTKLVLGDAKTYSSDRLIPIPSALANSLELYRKRNTGKFVIQGNSYEYTDPRTFQYVFHHYLEECNLRSINYHALRHTFATRCIEVGVDIKSLSEILGHATVNITLNTYVHSSMDLKRLQLDKLCAVCGQ